MYHHTATESLCDAKISWSPNLAGVSYQFGFIPFSICLQFKISWFSFFLFSFPITFLIIKQEMFDPSLRKKLQIRWLGELKKSQSKVLRFWQKSYSFKYDILVQHESANIFFLIFAKTACLQKSGSSLMLVMVKKAENKSERRIL